MAEWAKLEELNLTVNLSEETTTPLLPELPINYKFTLEKNPYKTPPKNFSPQKIPLKKIPLKNPLKKIPLKNFEPNFSMESVHKFLKTIRAIFEKRKVPSWTRDNKSKFR